VGGSRKSRSFEIPCEYLVVVLHRARSATMTGTRRLTNPSDTDPSDTDLTIPWENKVEKMAGFGGYGEFVETSDAALAKSQNKSSLLEASVRSVIPLLSAFEYISQS
jgi:hypothetical protein